MAVCRPRVARRMARDAWPEYPKGGPGPGPGPMPDISSKWEVNFCREAAKIHRLLRPKAAFGSRARARARAHGPKGPALGPYVAMYVHIMCIG